MSADDVEREVADDVLDSAEAGGRVIRGGAARSISYVASLLLSLASVPFMIRHLGKVDYGHYVAVSAIVFIVGGVTEAGLTNLGIRDYSATSDRAERDRLLRNLVGLRLALTAAGIAVAVLLTSVTGSEDVIVTGTAIMGLGLFLSLTQQTYMIPLTAQLRLGTVAILELLKQAVLTGAFVLFVLVGAGLVPFFWASVLSAVVMTAATIALIRADAPLLPSFDLAAWRAILRETAAYALAAAVGLVYFRIAVILMTYVATDDETGWFGAAFRIVEVVGVIPWLLVTSSFPLLARAARDDEARLEYALQRMFEVATVVGTLIGLGLAVSAPFAIDVVAGPGFGPSVDVLRIQAVGLLTTFLLATWLFALLSLKRHKELLLVNVVAAIVASAGTLLLAPPLGAEGAAIATVAAEAVLAVGCLYFLTRDRSALRPRLGVVPKVAAAAAAGVGVALVVPIHPLPLAMLSVAVAAAVMVALRAIPPELHAALLRRQ